MTPAEYCQNKVAHSGSSLVSSFKLLPQDKRDAITALYAFCREVDDVVDESSDTTAARAALEGWREEIERLYRGSPRHPVSRALQPALARFSLDRTHLEALVDGMEMDLDKRRYASFDELSLYCYRVASVVGLLAATIFGYRNAATLDYARELGMAFQLTNILRDIAEDAARDRIYIPLDELERFEVSESAVLNSRFSDNMRALLQFQAQRAADYYDSALGMLPEADRYRQRSGLVMAAIYRKNLDRIVSRDFPVFGRSVRIPTVEKIWLTLRTLAMEEYRYRVKGEG